MQEGVDGLLRDKTRKPGKAPIPAETVARVVALTCADPPHAATHWTGRAMAKAAGISLRSVQRIWEAHQLQPHRPLVVPVPVRDQAERPRPPQHLGLEPRHDPPRLLPALGRGRVAHDQRVHRHTLEGPDRVGPRRRHPLVGDAVAGHVHRAPRARRPVAQQVRREAQGVAQGRRQRHRPPFARGDQGRGLAFRFARAGHSVIIGSRSEERARTVASLLGHHVQGMANRDAALLLEKDPLLTGPRGQAARSLLALFGRDAAMGTLRAG